MAVINCHLRPVQEAVPANPLEAVLQRLTQVVETLAKDKKPANGQSKLDAHGVRSGSGSAQDSSGAPRRTPLRGELYARL